MNAQTHVHVTITDYLSIAAKHKEKVTALMENGMFSGMNCKILQVYSIWWWWSYQAKCNGALSTRPFPGWCYLILNHDETQDFSGKQSHKTDTLSHMTDTLCLTLSLSVFSVQPTVITTDMFVNSIGPVNAINMVSDSPDQILELSSWNLSCSLVGS